MNVSHKGVNFTLVFVQCLGVLKHRLRERFLQSDLVTLVEGLVDVSIDLLEMPLHVIGFEIHELVFYAPKRHERYHFVLKLVEDASIHLVRIFVREG